MFLLRPDTSVTLEAGRASIRSRVVGATEKEIILTPELSTRTSIRPGFDTPVFLMCQPERDADEVYSVLLWYAGRRAARGLPCDAFIKERSTECVRRYEDVTLMVFCWCKVKIFSLYDGEVIVSSMERANELSENGIDILTYHKVDRGAFVECSFEIGGVEMTLMCRVARFNTMAKGQYNKVGMEFVDMTPEQRSSIRRYLLAEQSRRLRG